jgi:hypothetical protein
MSLIGRIEGGCLVSKPCFYNHVEVFQWWRLTGEKTNWGNGQFAGNWSREKGGDGEASPSWGSWIRGAGGKGWWEMGERIRRGFGEVDIVFIWALDFGLWTLGFGLWDLE